MSNNYRKITLTTLTPNIIKKINALKAQNPKQKILIEIPNTRGISSELIKLLDENIDIRIAGAYDEERIKRLGNIVYDNGETGEYYTSAVIYTRNEVIKIISEIEKIEEGLQWQTTSQLEKLIYIYGKLKRNIMYDPKFETKSSKDTRSLRGLITKETVCAGYAIILKELLDRQEIECHYVSGKTNTQGRTCMEYSHNRWKKLSY